MPPAPLARKYLRSVGVPLNWDKTSAENGENGDLELVIERAGETVAFSMHKKMIEAFHNDRLSTLCIKF
ncbi:hypothetical protein RRG08_007505 [Elysia crispata]|uniref:Uncharacterized protein n=1 Tax=Elysia crispata TaxID=231223 RepID=A0AAE1DES6_9GAST|nr:hypothetical protein RRG08_007505 [Elysia crispata]